MAGGKGGSTTSSVTIPEYIEEAARRNLAKAEGISQIGYVPYFGPDVAAFTPFQQAGFQQTADVASAFGLGTPTTQADIMGGMPEPTQFAGGVRGYSAAPLYQQAVDELAAQRPAQAQYIESFFIDPVTGQAGTRVQPAVDYSTMGTMADIRAADRANELAIAQAQAAAGPQNVTFETTSFAANPNLAVQPNDQIFNIAPPEVQIAQQIMATDPTNPQYNEAFQTVYDYQAAQAAQDPTGQSTGLGITPEIIDAAGVDAFLPPTVPSDYTLDPAISAAIDEIGYTPIEGRPLAEGEQAILGLEPQDVYNIGEAGEFSTAAATPEIDYGAYLTPVSQPTTSDPLYDTSSNSQYAGFMDMFDGGGPNASGGSFEGGGLLSDAANFMAQGGVIGGVVKAIEDALGIGPAAAAPALPATPAVPATSVSLDNPLLMGSTARAGAVQTSNPNVSVVSTPSGNQYFGTPVGTDPATGSTRYSF
jgi:hypothetical protein